MPEGADAIGENKNTMDEAGKRPERRNGRPSVYSGEGYVPGERITRPRKDRKPEPSDGMSLKEKLRQRKRRKLRKVLLGIGALLVLAYLVTAVYFSSHFYEGTTVYGIDCSQKTLQEVKLDVEERLNGYVLEIQERGDKTETISADQIDLKYVDNGAIDRMMKAQRAYIWPVMLLLGPESGETVSFSYDKELAQARINGLECMNSILAVAPQDAYIGATDTGYEVVSEVMGTTLQSEKARNTLLAALDAGAVKISLDEEGCYMDPEIRQDNEELQHDAAAMSELATAKITYIFGDATEIVDAELIRNWIVRLADGSFVIDDMRVTDYVESLAAKYDTFGLPLDFYTSLGTTVTLSGGDYGWCIDQEATVVALLNALESGYRGEMEPEYLYTAMSHENQGIGYTYVEICISQQRMWCYQDGNLIVDTPVVTGNPNKGNATPSGGVWAIDAKKRDAILNGEGYTAPVDYWMPFNGDVGIHDMQQRAYFGGTIYLTNGSHGCVNTPYDQVQIIYNAVSIGTPVIVYE